ncbi:hypothetical protein C6A87_014370 [Mycobacterium sp. ITM-2016-00317]|uniref:hypothetical protein n=1 Tax=Mycobacterium sp. ITM-2016-00317 TaxID=2099694 RepID=UPI00287FDDBC|nr:hypothetical protein [Mycobacterium sp. ITM-2016-00317]WNG85163.1 hypothetical protein C6A87_014370 [Mycobacterium sp. ITM-2016-00317]
MPGAVKPYITAGVALVGASVISVTPIAPQVIAERATDRYVALTAAASNLCETEPTSALCTDTGSADVSVTNRAVFGESSLLYIPGNLFNALLSLPAWEIQAMDRLADAMIGTGSWQVWGPTNVFGFDEWDPPKLKAFIDVLMPFKPFSSVLGEQMSVWAQANLPMNSGCAGTPGACPDMSMLLASMFKVPVSQLYDGYTFPGAGEQGSTNPFDGTPVSWAGTTVQLEPWGPFKNTWEWLTTPPKPVASVPLADFIRVPLKLAKSLFDAFNPFVQNSSIFNPKNGLIAVVAKALAPLFCKNCNFDNLYDNPWLYDNYDPHPPVEAAGTEDDAQKSESDGSGTTEGEAESGPDQPPAGEGTDDDAPVDTEQAAVSTLLSKFQSAGTEDEGSGADEDSTPSPAEEPAEEPVEDPEEPVDEVEDDAFDEATDEDDEDTDKGGKHRLDDGDDDNSVQSIQDKVDGEKDKKDDAGDKGADKNDGGSESGSGND